MISISIKKTPTNQNESGIIAIFSVLIIMGILTLLTIGFSGITRQAQKRALDDFLNTQAFYAAESGVNSALEDVRTGAITTQNTDCTGAFGAGEVNPVIDAGRNIRLSCLLVNPTPTDVVFDSVPEVGVGEPVTSAVRSLTPTEAASYLEIEWDSPNGSADPLVNYNFSAGSPVLPSDTVWGNSVGMVRVDVVPATISPSDRAGLVNGGYTFYLYPTRNTSVLASNSVGVLPGPNHQAGTLITRCNLSGDYRCFGRINFHNAAGTPTAFNHFYVRIQAYYNPVRISIAPKTSSNNSIQLRDGQAVIDSTGQANDVFRRIQVRAPIRPDGAWNEGYHEVFAIFSGDSLCKRYIGAPTAADGSGGTTIGWPSGVTDPACRVN